MQTAQDIYFMTLAIEAAKKGLYTARPNPAVGCVIVQQGQLIGEGFHPKAGQPHAEIFALNDAKTKGFDVRGATAYVTLEPCSHTGRTPPCADALIQAGVARVVIATTDSNPRVSGGGIAKLQNVGIDVVVGVCEAQAKQLNLGFLKAMATGLPYVRLKTAISLDGRTAMSTGESKWITGEKSRQDVQQLRAKSAAIITGSGTILADNPRLNVRSTRLGVANELIVQPKVVIVDRRGQLLNADGQQYHVLQDANTLIHQGDLLDLLKSLVSEHACYDVLVEAGATLGGAFIEQDLVDELIVYQAPCILGINSKPMFDIGLDVLSMQKRYTLKEVERFDNDIRLNFCKIS